MIEIKEKTNLVVKSLWVYYFDYFDTGVRHSCGIDRNNRGDLCNKLTVWDEKNGLQLVRYSREFGLNVIVITEYIDRPARLIQLVIKNLNEHHYTRK